MAVNIKLLFSLLFATVVVLADQNVIVKDNRLYVNCEEFFIKSFCYSPTPLGRSDPESNVSNMQCYQT